MPDTAPPDRRPAADDIPVDERTLVLERLLPAPPERVFRAFTDPAVLGRWWGPEGFETTGCTVDARPGGTWRTGMTGPDGGGIVGGVFLVVEPPGRLAFSWAWEDESGTRGHETEVHLTFTPAGSGTVLRLVQRVFLGADDREAHNAGWESSLRKLERLLA